MPNSDYLGLTKKMNNMVNVDYTYQPDPTLKNYVEVMHDTSNVLPLDIHPKKELSASIRKLACPSYAVAGEIMSYTIIVGNTGNYIFTELELDDLIDPNTVMLEDSVRFSVIGKIADNITIPGIATRQANIQDQIPNENDRFKMALMIRTAVGILMEAYRADLVPAKMTQEEYDTIRNTVIRSYDNIKQVNDAYREGAGPAYLAIQRLHADIEDVANADYTGTAERNKLISLDFMELTRCFLNTGDLIEGSNVTERLWETFVGNCVKMLRYMLEVEQKLIAANKLDAGRKLRAEVNIANLQIRLNEYQDVGLIDDTYAVATDIIASPEKMEYAREFYEDTLSRLTDLIPEVRYRETPGVLLLGGDVNAKIWGMTQVLGKIPNYPLITLADGVSKAPDYSNPPISRTEGLLQAAKNGIAALDTIILSLIEAGTHTRQAVLLTNHRNNLEVARRKNVNITDITEQDQKAASIASALSYSYDVVKALVDEGEVLTKRNVIAIQFTPLTCHSSIGEHPEDDPDDIYFEPYQYPPNIGNNEISPPEITAGMMPTVIDTIYNAALAAFTYASYAVVPEAAIVPVTDPEDYTKKDRVCKIFINQYIEPKDTVLINFSVKVLGKATSEDGTKSGLNYPQNINALNATEITNAVSIGFVPVIDGIPDLRQRVNPVDVTDLSTAPPSTYSKAAVPLRYAYLCTSKDVYKYGICASGAYDYCLTNNDVECGEKICYLATLKNYGPIAAENTTVRDLLRLDLNFTDYVPVYENEPQLSVQRAISYRYYPDRSSYETGVNNRGIENVDEIFPPIYACDTDEKVRACIKRGNNGPYAILRNNAYIEMRNLTVPERSAIGALRPEVNYLKEKSQTDRTNDALVGVAEIRIYYTVKCSDIHS